MKTNNMKTNFDDFLLQLCVAILGLIILVIISSILQPRSNQLKNYDISSVKKDYPDIIVTDQSVFDSLNIHFSFSSESKEDWEKYHEKKLELVSLKQYTFVFYYNYTTHAITGYAMIGDRYEWFVYCKEKFHRSKFVVIGTVIDYKKFCSQKIYIVV